MKDIPQAVQDCEAPLRSIIPQRDRPAGRRLLQLLVLLLCCHIAPTAWAVCEPVEGQGPEMVYLPGGTFTMGSPESEADRDSDEGPQRDVWIAPFALMRCEVSRGEFAAYVAAQRALDPAFKTESETLGCFTISELGKSDWEQRSDRDWQNGLYEAQDDAHPAICVSWNDAQSYAAWLSAQTGENYRLPSEAEFEYALRGQGPSEDPSMHFWRGALQCDYANGRDIAMGKVYTDLASSGVSCDDKFAYTAPVASFQVNGFGLHDMAGNVWEWNQDCWHGNYDNAPSDGRVWTADAEGDCDLGVLRGGGWFNEPSFLRSAYRSWDYRDDTDSVVGFRLARAP